MIVKDNRSGKDYDLLVFDLDGTLMATARGVLGCCIKAMKDMGYAAPPIENMRSYLGPPLKVTFMNTLHLTEEEADALVFHFREYYTAEGCMQADPFDGIFDTLKALRSAGYKITLGTNKRQDYADRMMGHFGFTPYLNAVYGVSTDGSITKSDLIRFGARDCGVSDMRRVIMIGDSKSDAKAAAEVGCDLMGVTYGYGFETEEDALSAGAIAVCDSPLEIRNFFCGK